jgi:hypothetical protein
MPPVSLITGLICLIPGRNGLVGVKNKSFTNPKLLLRPAKLVDRLVFLCFFLSSQLRSCLMNQNFTLLNGSTPIEDTVWSSFDALTAPGTVTSFPFFEGKSSALIAVFLLSMQLLKLGVTLVCLPDFWVLVASAPLRGVF